MIISCAFVSKLTVLNEVIMMSKNTITEKLAQKAFESDAVQRSWLIHTKAFGPILEQAFVDNYKARIDLTAALNFISNRDYDKGLDKLRSIEAACSADRDKAAWFFCMGLCMEMANRKDDMIACYQKAGVYKHGFYLPYLKIAKAAHNDAVFDTARENYIKAIQCLTKDNPDERDKVILGSVYTNLASCLTMMHCYKDAEEALKKSAEIDPEQKGRAAAEAILNAAEGNAETAYRYVDVLMTQFPAFYENTRRMVDDILNKREPQFNRITIDQDNIKAFWNWFVSNENSLLSKLKMKEYDAVFQLIQPGLKDVFPFMKRDLEFGIEPGEEFYQVTFADYYMVSLEYGYRELIDAMPESLSKNWRFDIER